jgi:hypothetical protein
MCINYTSKTQQSLNSLNQLIDTMKMTKIIPIAILCLMISVTIVNANHSSNVAITPNSWAKNTDKDVSLSVTNTNGDSITKIELIVPLDSNKVPLYIVGDVTRPEGWKYSTTGDPVSKITWTATGSGIASGSSLNLFGMILKSPNSMGNYRWNWTTSDKNFGTYSAYLTTTVGQAPVSSFVILVPTITTAGTSLKINVKALGDDSQIKADYTGKIRFTSTDANAVLPSEYTFLSSDQGKKDFSITYKTAGSQSFTVSDSSAGVSKESVKTLVKTGTATDIGISPEEKKVGAGDKVEYKVVAKDALGNIFDVTDKSTLSIDKKAGGTWNKNVYTAEKEGTWIVIASYNSLLVGTTLTVSGKSTTTVVTPTEQVNITESIPTGTTGEVEPQMSLTVPESIKITPGANETTIVTVNNNGDKGLTGVEVKVTGVPSEWINIYPLLNDIPAKSSKDYLVMVFVPSNETESKTLEFSAKSSEGVTATNNVSLTLTKTPTGSFAMPKNVLQLGVVIIAVAAVVIIAWELWFKKPKSK